MRAWLESLGIGFAVATCISILGSAGIALSYYVTESYLLATMLAATALATPIMATICVALLIAASPEESRW